MSVNVHRENEDYPSIFNEITTQNPDIFVLIEYTEKLHHEIQTSDLVNEYPFQHHAFTRHNGKDDGTGIYSKTPITAEKELLNKKIISLSVKIDGEKTQIIAVHLENPIVSAESKKLRDLQMKTIAKEAMEHNITHETPVLVIGDFNTLPFSHALFDLRNEANLRTPQTDLGCAPTWNPFRKKRTKYIGVQLDYALHTKKIKAHNFQLGNFISSDHYPIIFDFSVRKAGE